MSNKYFTQPMLLFKILQLNHYLQFFFIWHIYLSWFFKSVQNIAVNELWAWQLTNKKLSKIFLRLNDSIELQKNVCKLAKISAIFLLLLLQFPIPFFRLFWFISFHFKTRKEFFCFFRWIFFSLSCLGMQHLSDMDKSVTSYFAITTQTRSDIGTSFSFYTKLIILKLFIKSLLWIISILVRV